MTDLEYTENEDQTLFTLDTGKSKLFIELNPSRAFWVIRPEKGRLPVALEGVYTTVTFAKTAIKKYLSTRE